MAILVAGVIVVGLAAVAAVLRYATAHRRLSDSAVSDERQAVENTRPLAAVTVLRRKR